MNNDYEYEYDCPHCKSATLTESYCYDFDSDGDYATRKIKGYCPNCEKEYQWIERYEFIGVEDLREV